MATDRERILANRSTSISEIVHRHLLGILLGPNWVKCSPRCSQRLIIVRFLLIIVAYGLINADYLSRNEKPASLSHSIRSLLPINETNSPSIANPRKSNDHWEKINLQLVPRRPSIAGSDADFFKLSSSISIAEKGDDGMRLAFGLSGVSPGSKRSTFAARLLPNRQYVLTVKSQPIRRDAASELKWQRLALVGSASSVVAVLAFQRFNQYFGEMSHPFRISNDWSNDHSLRFDELLHFQGNYRIAQGLTGFFRWTGVPPGKAKLLGATSTLAVMSFLEYMDGRRPNSEASYSDVLANMMGVGFYLAKARVPVLRNFDLSFSYLTPGDILREDKIHNYDRMTHWLTYSLRSQLNVPLHIGLGYGIHNAFRTDVRPKLYLGLGTTPAGLLERYFPSALKSFSWLGIYHIGWQIEIV